ncbi:putative bifunctional diguanylate cyclase/phosphodiesterase [Pseudoduganella sp. OTU4001]|uniref:putative bifunctional diguanylate cyclase/phosphodiesterase n=1 Tax=Pseudoduganella sp. OTU4001 TaxID=3043854 RepID=UPI00313F1C94
MPDLIAVENARLQGELRDHIARLQEANRQLLISGINAQQLAQQLRAAQAEMTHLAHHDHLTTLPNRRQFKKQLADHIAHAAAQGAKLALLFIDLDRFKVVNDSLGHGIGDLLLQAVAQRLAASVRGSDAVCREGGDEFVAMLADVAHAEDVSARVAHIHHLLTAPYNIAHHVLHIGASIGISIYPDDVADIDALMRNADIAMYSVKEHGRNSFAFFEPPMDVRAVARHHMEVDLRKALEQNEFELYYQAQVNLASSRTAGAEALIRWHHPTKGLLLPKAFIGFAEECGIIKLIDRWVLREACRQAKAWQDTGYALQTISVNISAQEFECSDFLQAVFATLAQTGLPPQSLELELTEGTLMRDSAATIQKLEALRAAGIRIAIDDFGTGYSSLGYLRRFPIDTLKIDQTFVAGIHPGSEEVLVDSVISIGNRLHHHVVAEGIETAEQLDFLRAHACDTGQGFHLFPPLPATEFALTMAGKG